MVAILLPLLLLATSALARPSSRERLEARNAARNGQSVPRKPVQGFEALSAAAKSSNSTAESYSSNWAGAIYTWPHGYITGITGTFTVPSPSAPPGGDWNTAYSGTAWVGIDGDTCGQAILQSGVDWTVQSGEVSYGAWFEWFPSGWVNFDGISFNAGDSVTITISDATSTSGTATIVNNSNGQRVSQYVTAGGNPPLCQADVEWIMEDYSEGGLVEFANFGTIHFTDTVGYLYNGQGIGAANANTMDIVANNQVITSTTVADGWVNIQYE